MAVHGEFGGARIALPDRVINRRMFSKAARQAADDIERRRAFRNQFLAERADQILQRLVAGREHQRAVEIHVALHESRHIARLGRRFHHPQRLDQFLQIVRPGTPRRQPRRERLATEANLQRFEHAAAMPRHPVAPLGAHFLVLAGRRAQKAAATVADFHQVERGQELQRLAHGAAAEIELGGELALARQPVTDAELHADDQLADMRDRIVTPKRSGGRCRIILRFGRPPLLSCRRDHSLLLSAYLPAIGGRDTLHARR